MPLYDFACAGCGPFRAWRSMREAGEPIACPDCGQSAARLVVAPGLALMSASNRIAHMRNEKSAHEPKVVNRNAPDHGHRGHHHHGHGHAHQHRGGRPWMIGH